MTEEQASDTCDDGELASFRRSLEDSLAGRYTVAGLDFASVPARICAAVPSSPDIVGNKPRLPGGRGLTRRRAEVAALAEALELDRSLSPGAAWQGYETPGQGAPPAIAFADLLCCPGLRGPTSPDALKFVRMHDLATGVAVLVPAQCVFLDHAVRHRETLIMDADSTGWAVGRDGEDACLRALLECIERDALGIWWHGRHERPAIDITTIPRTAADSALLQWLSFRARDTLLFDIRCDTATPVYAALSRFGESGRVSIGVAANQEARQAALNALLELVQIEVSASLSAGRPGHLDDPSVGFLPAVPRSMAPHLFASEQRQPFEPGHAPPTDDQRLEALVEALRAVGLRALCVDRTPERFDGRVIKALVPGLRHSRTGLGPGRLYEVPLRLGWVERPMLAGDMEPSFPL